MTFTIPSGTFDKYYEVCDHLMENPHTSVLSTLVYPPIKVACSCQTIQGATNVAHHGGPASFFSANCPKCGGSGYKEEESTDTIRLRVNFDPKVWWREAQSLNIANATVKVIGYMKDWKKFIQAKEIRLFSHVDMGIQTYSLAGEPIPSGFGHNHYFHAFLSKV